MWTEKQSGKFQTPNHSKEFIRKPLILKELGIIRGMKVIEFGCGSGYWTRLLSAKGAVCVGVDRSQEQLMRALEQEKRKPQGITYILDDITHLKKVKSGQFDLVFIEYVLLEIPTRELLRKIFKEAHRVLKKKGKLFVSDMHPFDPIVHERFKLPKGFHYFKSGARMIAYAKQLDNTMIEFVDYHWTLEDYCSSIIDAGFAITALHEPRPTRKTVERVPYLSYRVNLPKDIIILAQKK